MCAKSCASHTVLHWSPAEGKHLRSKRAAAAHKMNQQPSSITALFIMYRPHPHALLLPPAQLSQRSQLPPDLQLPPTGLCQLLSFALPPQ